MIKKLIDKLVVGRYLDLNPPLPAMPLPAVAGFQQINRVVMHIEESEFVPAPKPKSTNILDRAFHSIESNVVRHRVSTTSVGEVTVKTHRNFVWLDWLPGLVSQVLQGGVDVLTGPMSGCWVTQYTVGGVQYVGHIGTVEQALDPQTVFAKASWNALAATLPPHARTGFRPMNDWAGAFPVGPLGMPIKIYGLVTATGDFYTIVMFPDPLLPSRLGIYGVQKITSTLPANGLVV